MKGYIGPEACIIGPEADRDRVVHTIVWFMKHARLIKQTKSN